MHNTTDFWELRSKEYQSDPRGVLPKSYPKSMNDYLHKWMSRIIQNTAHVGSILDIGCGYGRLSQEILSFNKKNKTVGIDISKTYVNLYNSALMPRGEAYVADMRKLPMKDQTFDTVVCATSLMYLTNKEDQMKAITEFARVLKPSGNLILIERSPSGHSFVTLGGVVTRLRGKKKREIHAVSYSPRDIRALTSPLFVQSHVYGMPAFTISFYLLFLISKFTPFLSPTALKFVGFADQRLSRILTPSLYVAYSLNKK